MSGPDEASGPYDGVDDPQSAAPRLWDGDLGEMHEQSRRALLEILKGPYLSGRRRPRLWSALVADEPVIRSRLHDLFLDLVIEPVDEFAFARKVRTTALEVPSLLRSENLTFIDTALLLVLRQHLLAASGEGRVIVGKDEVYERLEVYRNGDEATFRRNLNGAWTRALNKLRVLHPVDDERAEISPVIKFVLDHDEVVALTEQYRRMLPTEPIDGSSGPETEETA